MLYSYDFHYSKLHEESALLHTCKNAQWSVFRWLSLDRSKMSNDCAGPGRSSPSEPPPEVPLGVPQGTRYPEVPRGCLGRGLA